MTGITTRFAVQLPALVAGVFAVAAASLYYTTITATAGGLLLGLVVAGVVATLAEFPENER